MATTEVIKRYFEHCPVNKAYLFGSYARDEQRTDSDIDILVEVDYTYKVSLLDFIGWKIDLEKLLGKKVDLVAEDGLSEHIRPFIEKEKVIVYEK